MPLRRFEDLSVRILMATPAAADLEAAVAEAPGGLQLVEYAFDPNSGAPPHPLTAADEPPSSSVLVLRLVGDEMLFVAGAEMERLTSTVGASVLDRAAEEAVAWRRRRLHALRQHQADERLIVLAEQVNRQTTREGVFDAVMEYGPQVLEGQSLLVLLRAVNPLREAAVLRALPNPQLALQLSDIAIQPFLPLDSPGLITASEAAPGAPFAELAPLFANTKAALVAYVPFGDKGVLALVERRYDRVLEPDDWFRFSSISRHANAALDRVLLREQAQSLALMDAVTGLGNRRRLEVIMPYHLAAAQRGTPLSLAWFDLGEEGGEPASDAQLQLFAECLQQQCRATDAVVRYGGATFVALLPNAASAGAWSVVKRVRDRFTASVPFKVGIAAYGSDTSTFTRLLDEAGRSVRELPPG